ncbi:major facilitator superfamily domain-containing protein [Collybia nuda]|uniref:Major facilitator superfamily domain-containing protein n=1 Tax=Collybia nuda TaxID=64659 RepID=A0A9P5XY56_9AGAR|nr:major facilitator superfamily domain-containing protein [Collybia nuda]
MKTSPPTSLRSPTSQEKHNGSEADSLGDELTTFDPVLEKIVWRKMDKWILPVVAMFYLLSFLDRTNLGNARVAGLQTDLKMTDKEYSIALTLTYVPYIVAELPSNLLLKTVGPNLMLPTMLTLWGVVTTLQGVVKSYQGLLACRFFLGLFEGGVFPGLVLYLSFFYPRQQLQWRISAFFSTASISGAFSGLLAFGIINMEGVGNRPGWAWIFILEGLFTFLFGVSAYFTLPRSPLHAPFFSEKEKLYVVERLREAGSTGQDEDADKFSWREVGQALLLPQVWMLAIIFFFDGSILYGLAYFTPSIVQTLGYTAARAQLMSVPPYASCFVVTMIAAYVSDRYHCRGFVSMFCSILCIVGLSMFLGSSSHTVKYGSLFLSITGAYCAAAALSTWSANNAAPHTRRATAIAIGFIMTNSGGILATWLLGSLSPSPLYTKATITLLVFAVLMLVFSSANTYYLYSQNRKKVAIRAVISRHEEKKGLGDRSAWFIYNT